MKRKLRDALVDFFQPYANASQLFKMLLMRCSPLLIGGAVRSYLEAGGMYLRNEPPRDFDFVIRKICIAEFEKIIKKIPFEKNRFGGYKVFVDDFIFDIWKLETTWAFRHGQLKTKRANLYRSVFLNIDSIVYDLMDDKFYNNIYFHAKKTNTLDVVFQPNPCVELNLLRALCFKRKYHMRISKKLRNLFLESINENPKLVDDMYKLQMDHYGVAKLSLDDIKREVNSINHELLRFDRAICVTH